MPKIIAKNKTAFYNYEIEKIFEAGIELLGWEVKSIRANNVNFTGSYCYFKNEEVFVANMHIDNYMEVAGDPTRDRKLLLNRNEIDKIKVAVNAQKKTIIPISMIWSNKGFVKLEIAIAKGKNLRDKRETIKERDLKRQIKHNLGV